MLKWISPRRRARNWYANLRWSGLRRLGENRVARTSWVWLVIVPASAKLVHKLQEQVRGLDVTEHPWAAFVNSLYLPFAWEILFAAALGFTIGTLVFSFACPAMIQENSGLAEFQREGKSLTNLAWYAVPFGKIPVAPQEEGGTLRQLENDRGNTAYIAIADSEALYTIYSDGTVSEIVSEKSVSTIFWRMWGMADEHRTPWIAGATLAYYFGFCMVAWIAISNALWVARVWWGR
jgi:hypothetical protein